MMEIKKFTRSGKGCPMYTKRIMEISNTYVLNGEVLKSRYIKPELVDVETEAFLFNDVAVEEDGGVTIYCKEDRLGDYEKEIQWLENMYGEGFGERFTIYCR